VSEYEYDNHATTLRVHVTKLGVYTHLGIHMLSLGRLLYGAAGDTYIRERVSDGCLE